MKIPLSQIRPSPKPIRSSWDEEKMEELAQSIKAQGLIVPIKVRPVDGNYEIVYGHRRTEAARRAQLAEIECFIEGLDDTAVLVQALIENIQREDLQPMDVAHSLDALGGQTGWGPLEISKHGIMGRRTAARFLALLKEPVTVQELVARGKPGGELPKGRIGVTHVDQIKASGADALLRGKLAEKVAKECLTGTQIREVANSVTAAKTEKRRDYLLKRPYHPSIHNANEVKAREEQFGDHDPLLRKGPAKPTISQEWEVLPTVKNIIDMAKMWRKELKELERATDLGKLAPEAKWFVARRLKPFADRLNKWIEEMERRE